MPPLPWTIRWLAALLGVLFVASSVYKFASSSAAEQFARMGLGDKLSLIACGEMLSAVLLLWPRTFSLGVLLLSSYMGGAIVVHMSKAESYLAQSIILLLIWLTAFLRHPEMFASLWNSSPTKV